MTVVRPIAIPEVAEQSHKTESFGAQWVRRSGRASAGLSLVLLLAIVVSYWGRFDACAAVTVYPAWFWFAAGVTLLVPALRMRTPLARIVIGLWCVYLLAFFDSPLSLMRAFFPSPPAATGIRIATLNCAGEPAAGREVLTQNPDIVLLQETPSREAVAAIAAELYGDQAHSCWSADNSLVSRFDMELMPIPEANRANYVHARIQVADGPVVDVVSVRLFPTPLRMDLWNPRCWQVYADNSRKHRGQLARIASQLRTVPADRPLILAGDFNAPPGDAVFRLLRPRLSEAFAAAGRGWGRTFMSGFPILRIDQVWSSQQLKPIQVFAVASDHSDHKMVVADFDFAH